MKKHRFCWLLALLSIIATVTYRDTAAATTEECSPREDGGGIEWSSLAACHGLKSGKEVGPPGPPVFHSSGQVGSESSSQLPVAHNPALLEHIATAAPSYNIVVVAHADVGDAVAGALSSYSARESVTLSWSSCEEADVRVINKLAMLHTTVMIMCPTGDVLRVFQQVRNESLENRKVWWAVLSDDVSIGDQLQDIIGEGVQMGLAVRQYGDDYYALARAQVEPSGDMRFKGVGKWYIPATGSPGRSVEDLYLDPEVFYNNFNGRILITTALPTITFFDYMTLDNGTHVPTGGVDVEMLNMLSKRFNFTYVIAAPDERVWGGPQQDGSVTGLIGHVAKRKSNMAICKITITHVREQVVDFSTAYFTEGYSIVSAAPKIVGESKSILRPFTLPVWGIVIAIVSMIGPIVYTIDRVGSKAKFDYFYRSAHQLWQKCQNPKPGYVLSVEEKHYVTYQGDIPMSRMPVYSFNLFRNIVIQGNQIFTNVHAARFVFAIWYIFGLVITCLYSGVLTSVYAVPTYSKSLDNLEEVVAAGQRGEVIPLLNYQNSMDTMFKRAKKGTLYNSIIALNVPGVTYNYPVGTGARYNMVKKGGYTSFNSNADARALTLQNGRFNYHIGKELFYFQSYGIVLQVGAPYKGVFDAALLRIVEAGLQNKFLDERLKQLLGIKLFMQESFVKQRDLTTTGITLTHTQGAFYLLLGGAIVGALVLAIEICTFKKAADQA